uniref:Vomeronasal type-1 receptor n=1 Tax=Bos indicus x Bos taurus TaxID=30522 RepID=A0A4W2EFP0_BOBOX
QVVTVNALRTISQVALKTTYLTQIGVGSLANVILLFHNISPVLLGHKQRPPHTILSHMALSNLLFLLSSGVPYTMAAFVLRKPLSGLGCKFVYYIQRVALGTTLCSTCILSTYQSFTLTPRRVTGPSCFTCWMVSLLMYIYIPVKITGPQDTHNYTDSQHNWFCSVSGNVIGLGYLWSVSDAMFIGLMVWSSGSMVLFLLRHRQRVQYIHTPTGHHRCSPETRATHTILMLMVTFVVFYLLNYSFVFHISAFSDFHLWLFQVSNVLASCFPTISPLLLLLRDPIFAATSPYPFPLYTLMNITNI